MEQQMLPLISYSLNAPSFWQRDEVSLTAAMQQAQPFRMQTRKEVEVVWQWDEADDRPHLCRVEDGERKFQELYVPVESSQCVTLPDSSVRGEGISPWGSMDFAQLMMDQAQDMDWPLDQFAQKYARVILPAKQEGWRWHPTLGFAVKA